MKTEESILDTCLMDKEMVMERFTIVMEAIMKEDGKIIWCVGLVNSFMKLKSLHMKENGIKTNSMVEELFTMINHRQYQLRDLITGTWMSHKTIGNITKVKIVIFRWFKSWHKSWFRKVGAFQLRILRRRI